MTVPSPATTSSCPVGAEERGPRARDVDRSESITGDVVELELGLVAGRLFGDDPFVVECDHPTGEGLRRLGLEVDHHRLERGRDRHRDVGARGVDQDVGGEDQRVVEPGDVGDAERRTVAGVDDRDVASGVGPGHRDRRDGPA